LFSIPCIAKNTKTIPLEKIFEYFEYLFEKYFSVYGGIYLHFLIFRKLLRRFAQNPTVIQGFLFTTAIYTFSAFLIFYYFYYITKSLFWIRSPWKISHLTVFSFRDTIVKTK